MFGFSSRRARTDERVFGRKSIAADRTWRYGASATLLMMVLFALEHGLPAQPRPRGQMPETPRSSQSNLITQSQTEADAKSGGAIAPSYSPAPQPTASCVIRTIRDTPFGPLNPS